MLEGGRSICVAPAWRLGIDTPSGTSDTIVLPSEVSVGDAAVQALNDALGVEVFEAGLRLGRLTTSAERP